MAVPFVAQVKIAQSGDASNIIMIDDSNYLTNTEGITAVEVISRSVLIKDDNGATVGTVALTLQDDGSYSGLFPIAKDFYYSYLMTLTLPASVTKTGTTNYVSIGYWNNAFLQVMTNYLGDCGCSKGGICTDVSWSRALRDAAIIFADKGMGVLSQNSIDAANQFLTNILNG